MSEAENKELESYIESADPPAPEVEGDIIDKKEPEIPEAKEEDTEFVNSSGEKETDGEAVVIKAQQDAGILKKESTDNEEGEDIPDEFTKVALDQGWTEKEIIEFASGLDDDILLSLIPELLESEGEKKVDDTEPNEDSAKQTKQQKSSAEKDSTNDELAKLQKELKELREELSASKEERAVKQERAMVNQINQAFDEAAAEFKIFGKTDELLTYPAGPKKGQFVPTTSEMVARGEVWNKAYPLIQAGWDVKGAMDVAITWYKGAHLEEDVKQKVIQGLKKHEHKLSAKRSGKETVKTYEDEDERKADVVRQAARKAGVKGI